MRTALDYIGFVAYLAVMNGTLPDPELLKAAHKGRNGDWKAVWDAYVPSAPESPSESAAETVGGALRQEPPRSGDAAA